MTPTPEQSAILDAVTGSAANLMINALAGTGKTATLKMIDKHNTAAKHSLYLAFNKQNAVEATKAQKRGEFKDATRICTFNGFGHRLWAGQIAHNIVLNTDKTRDMIFAYGEANPEKTFLRSRYGVISEAIDKAKIFGYVPLELSADGLISRDELFCHLDEDIDDEIAGCIDDILRQSIKLAWRGQIDFNDQIYMPALFGKFTSVYDCVMVDEFQDQSSINYKLLCRIDAKRVIGVGDPNQNIYGFRGARAGGMHRASRDFNMTQFPLSVSFRCPEQIVRATHWHVPHFRWMKPGGSVESPDTLKLAALTPGSAVICRNNAPLLKLAMQLLLNGRNVDFGGSDIGKSLLKILHKLETSRKNASLATAIEKWRNARIRAGSKSANDIADCLRILSENATTFSEVILRTKRLFDQKGSIHLMTGHKAKGLEFQNVIWLDPGLVNIKDSQEANLAYVITTRSENSLIRIDSDRIFA